MMSLKIQQFTGEETTEDGEPSYQYVFYIYKTPTSVPSLKEQWGRRQGGLKKKNARGDWIKIFCWSTSVNTDLRAWLILLVLLQIHASSGDSDGSGSKCFDPGHRLGRVSHLWFEFGFENFPQKMSNFLIFFYLRVQKNWSGQRRVGLLFTASQN